MNALTLLLPLALIALARPVLGAVAVVVCVVFVGLYAPSFLIPSRS